MNLTPLVVKAKGSCPLGQQSWWDKQGSVRRRFQYQQCSAGQQHLPETKQGMDFVKVTLWLSTSDQHLLR